LTNSEKYSNVFIKIFSISKVKLKKLKYQSIPQWDSVGHMSMISKLEDAFKITMDIDDIVDFSSYEKGKKILKKYKIQIK
jgi:acyl carrier protein